MHRPRPPLPSRFLYSSAVVVLQRTGSTSMFRISFQLVELLLEVPVELPSPPPPLPLVSGWSPPPLRSAPSGFTPSSAVEESVVLPSSVVAGWNTMCVALPSPVRSPITLPEMKPLLSTQIIGLKCISCSGVMTLYVLPLLVGRVTTVASPLPATAVPVASVAPLLLVVMKRAVAVMVAAAAADDDDFVLTTT